MGIRVLKLGSKGKAVRVLQKMLNLRGKLPHKIPELGEFDQATKEAVQYFQRRAGLKPDGTVGPKTATALAKVVGPKAAPFAKAFGVPAHAKGAKGLDGKGAAKPAAISSKLSGAAWFRANQAKYPNSDSPDKLDTAFKANVKAFLNALKAAKPKVVPDVTATLRHPSRAYLMHWCYLIAKGSAKPSAVPKRSDVDIVWDHKNDEASRKAAQEMVKLFRIVHQPALTSRHIEGKAIDMSIAWSGDLKIKDKKGKEVTIKSSPKNGENKELIEVGRSYGVIKLVGDEPHWSTDGH